MKFKVGDRVRVKAHQAGLCSDHGCAYMAPEMLGYVGKKFTVGSFHVSYRKNVVFYKFNGFLFSNCMLEKVSNNRGKNPRGADGRFMLKKKDRKTEFEHIFWSFDLPDNITINGVKYVKEDHV